MESESTNGLLLEAQVSKVREAAVDYVVNSPSPSSSPIPMECETATEGEGDTANANTECIPPEFFSVNFDDSEKLCGGGDGSHDVVLSQPNEHLKDTREFQNSISGETATTPLLLPCDMTESSKALADPGLPGEDVSNTPCNDPPKTSCEDISDQSFEDAEDHITSCEGQEVGKSVEGDKRNITSMNCESGVVSRNISPEGVNENMTGTINKEVNEEDEGDQIVYFVNKDAKISPSPVLQYVLDIDQPFDTVISCADGKVGAHRIVITAASPFIGSLFCIDHRLGEVAHIILPDIRIAIMKILLNFCYTGSMMFPKEDKKEVLDTMVLLRLGEFGELTLKEVKLNENPPPMSSVSNIFSEQQQQSSSARIERNLSHRAESSSAEPRVQVSELLSSSSSSSEDGEDDSDTENEENYEPTTGMRIGTNLDMENERPVLNTVYNSSAHDTSKSYSYVILPPPPGSTVKKFKCARCPAAFKSIPTLEEHLEDGHSVYLESRELNKAELQKLLKCGCCNIKHNAIQLTNHCLSKHKRTRCFICFESVSLKKFEQHITTNHGTKQSNGTCIVKCTWCDVGMVFSSPFDNKQMSAHCFSKHFSNVGSLLATPDPVKPVVASSSKTDAVFIKEAEASSSSSSLRINSNPHPASSSYSFNTNSKPGPASSKQSKPIPNVLAMLQKASQKKRKVARELDFDAEAKGSEKIPTVISTTKRIRLGHENEENGAEKQEVVHMSKRTGKPAGFKIEFAKLSSEMPAYKSKSVCSKNIGGGKIRSVWLDVSKLSSTYATLRYSKTFIADKILELETQNSDEVSKPVEEGEKAISPDKILRLEPESDQSVEEYGECTSLEQVTELQYQNDVQMEGNENAQISLNEVPEFQQPLHNGDAQIQSVANLRVSIALENAQQLEQRGYELIQAADEENAPEGNVLQALGLQSNRHVEGSKVLEEQQLSTTTTNHEPCIDDEAQTDARNSRESDAGGEDVNLKPTSESPECPEYAKSNEDESSCDEARPPPLWRVRAPPGEFDELSSSSFESDCVSE